MKILKKANQKNFTVDIDYYTEDQLRELANKGKIFNLDIVDTVCSSSSDPVWVVFAGQVKEIKIVLDDYGYYRPVVIIEDGTQIYIEL